MNHKPELLFLSGMFSGIAITASVISLLISLGVGT